MSSLPKLVVEPILAKTLPMTLHMQLDNSAKDNKCHYVFCFWSLLMDDFLFFLQRGICVFLMVSHMHDNIDALFGSLEHEVA